MQLPAMALMMSYVFRALAGAYDDNMMFQLEMAMIMHCGVGLGVLVFQFASVSSFYTYCLFCIELRSSIIFEACTNCRFIVFVKAVSPLPLAQSSFSVLRHID